MGMDSGIIKSMGQMYPCPGELHVAGRKIGDTHPFNRPCSVAEIMKESSNVGTAQIADQSGAARQRKFLQQMGFMDRVAVEMKERGRTLTPRDWSRTDVMTVGFGHSIAVTPLHLAIGYATLFNGGIYRPATLLKVDKDHPAGKGRRVFSDDTSYKMRALLRLVVTHGTGKKADAPGYRVGGKTGTADKVIGGRYSNSLVITTFAGVFPMDEPRYVIVVMLDEPKATAETYGFRYAGWNVAPVVSQTISRIAPMLGVVPRHGPRAQYGPSAALRSRKSQGLTPAVRLSDLAGINSDSEVTGFAIDHRKVAPRQRVRSVRGRARQRRGVHRRGGRARRGRGRRPARGRRIRRAAHRRPRAAASLRRRSPPNSTRHTPKPSSQ